MTTFQTQKLVAIAFVCAGAMELFFMPLSHGGGQALLVSAWSATEMRNGMMGIDQLSLVMEAMRWLMVTAFLYLLIPDSLVKPKAYRPLWLSAKAVKT